jgi:hypothetical protein
LEWLGSFNEELREALCDRMVFFVREKVIDFIGVPPRKLPELILVS